MPSAEVIQFPETSRFSFARAIALDLSRLDFDAGKKHWQNVCRDLRKRLRSDGVSTDAVRIMIKELADDVHHQLRDPSLQKQMTGEPTVILSMKGETIATLRRGDGAGEAGVLGQGTKFLAGLGGAHETPEYDAAHAREGGAA
ncbi:hypothetical protein IE4872_CH01603 [Rhizobium gallicum]|uniref:Uncharacterized protein n=2 Tax=Rhizobium gallicum TaxID=56730 RepID=A0A1L5NH42_9HYPH|nr:hypothetical protein IE4872_CH01603 [Rhizobium gallicum]